MSAFFNLSWDWSLRMSNRSASVVQFGHDDNLRTDFKVLTLFDSSLAMFDVLQTLHYALSVF